MNENTKNIKNVHRKISYKNTEGKSKENSNIDKNNSKDYSALYDTITNYNNNTNDDNNNNNINSNNNNINNRIILNIISRSVDDSGWLEVYGKNRKKSIIIEIIL